MSVFRERRGGLRDPQIVETPGARDPSGENGHSSEDGGPFDWDRTDGTNNPAPSLRVLGGKPKSPAIARMLASGRNVRENG